MGALRFSHDDRLAWGDADQTNRLKLPVAVRLAWNANSQFSLEVAGLGRHEFFTTYAMAPVSTFIGVEIADADAFLDDDVTITVDNRIGYHLGSKRRYGGIQEFAITKTGTLVASLRHYWVWFSFTTLTTFSEPAPGAKPGISQDEELAPMPAPPDLAAAAPAGSFRWTMRDTDLNQHVQSLAWIERAENVAADALGRAESYRKAGIWFRQPALAGEEMAPQVVPGPEPVVHFAKAAGESCCVIALS